MFGCPVFASCVPDRSNRTLYLHPYSKKGVKKRLGSATNPTRTHKPNTWANNRYMLIRMLPSDGPGSRKRRSSGGREPTNTAPKTRTDDCSYPVYRDWDRIPLEYVRQLQSSHQEETKGKGGKKSTFPTKLYDLLENAEALGYSDVVSWQPHGRSFSVKDKKRFIKEVSPQYFGSQNEFASFQRQLNVYGFLRMTRKGPDRSSYYHELFLRGRPDMVALMPRKRNTTASVRRSLDPLTEPDLYKLPPSLVNQKPMASAMLPQPDARVSLLAHFPTGMMTEAATLPAMHIDPHVHHGFATLASPFVSHSTELAATERIPNMALSSIMGPPAEPQNPLAAAAMEMRHPHDTASLSAHGHISSAIGQPQVLPAAAQPSSQAATLATKESTSSSEGVDVDMSKKDVADMVNFLSDVDL